jgi:ubiquinone/menaquinone biosynthesis C-methylase UbiE
MPNKFALHRGTMGGRFAEPGWYQAHAGRLTRRLHARVIADARAAGLRADARVLDAGTGPGLLPRALAAAEPGWVVDGVDLDPVMIEFARRQPGGERVTFTVGDVARLPFPDETFDLIVSTISQHHWPDVPGALRDLRRVLRPGGRLEIYDAAFALRGATKNAKITFGPSSVRRSSVPTPLRVYRRLSAVRAPSSIVDSIQG